MILLASPSVVVNITILAALLTQQPDNADTALTNLREGLTLEVRKFPNIAFFWLLNAPKTCKERVREGGGMLYRDQEHSKPFFYSFL